MSINIFISLIQPKIKKLILRRLTRAKSIFCESSLLLVWLALTVVFFKAEINMIEGDQMNKVSKEDFIMFSCCCCCY